MLFRFIRSRSGATAIEYALIAALISLAIVSGAGMTGDKLFGLWQDNGNELQEAFGQQ